MAVIILKSTVKMILGTTLKIHIVLFNYKDKKTPLGTFWCN